MTTDQNRPRTEGAEAPVRDRWAARFRERMAAAIAGGIVLITLALVVVAAFNARSAENFGRLKDLLLFVNPVVGVVIGYYFSRVSTETRAENAESTASAATEAATIAGRARDEAAAQAERSRGLLAEIVDASTQAGGGLQSRTLGAAPDERQPEDSARMRLDLAIARARAELGREEGLR